MFESALGVDASLSGTGLCAINPCEKFVVMDRILFKEPFEKTFKGLFDRIQEVNYNFGKFVRHYNPDEIAMESPLPVGQMAAGGSSLCVVLANSVLKNYKAFFSFHPSYLRFLLNRRAYTHTQLVELAKRIIGQEGFVTSVKTFSADEAVAFLLAYRICLVRGYEPQVVEERFDVKKEVVIKGVNEWPESRLQREKGKI